MTEATGVRAWPSLVVKEFRVLSGLTLALIRFLPAGTGYTYRLPPYQISTGSLTSSVVASSNPSSSSTGMTASPRLTRVT